MGTQSGSYFGIALHLVLQLGLLQSFGHQRGILQRPPEERRGREGGREGQTDGQRVGGRDRQRVGERSMKQMMEEHQINWSLKNLYRGQCRLACWNLKRSEIAVIGTRQTFVHHGCTQLCTNKEITRNNTTIPHFTVTGIP